MIKETEEKISKEEIEENLEKIYKWLEKNYPTTDEESEDSDFIAKDLEIERLNNIIIDYKIAYETVLDASKIFYKERERLHSIIKEAREKLLCYGETFDLKVHQQMQKELLEILDKVEEK